MVVQQRATPQLTPAWFRLRHHPTQRALWTCPARFVCLPSGRGSGKTLIAKRRLAAYSAIDRDKIPMHLGGRPPEAKGLKHLYAALGPTRQWVKRVWWDDLKALIPSAWVRKISESDLIIYTKFNSEIHCIGMDKPDRFEGDQWDGVVEDEASDQKARIHLSVRPAITIKRGWWWKIGIPKRYGSGAPEYRKMCFAGMKRADGTFAEPELRTFSWPSWDIIPQEEVDEMKRRMDPKDFLEQVGGQWQQAGGSAFHQFNRDLHVRQVKWDPNRPILVTCDFNVSPMSWVLGQLDPDVPGGEGIGFFDEVWVKDTHTGACMDLLWQKYGEKQKGGWHFYGDAAARQRSSNASLSNYAIILNDRRFNAQVTFPEANPGRIDRLASCNAMLMNAADEVRCHIDPQCEMLINDLENRGVEPTGEPTDPKDVDGLIGHISDAFGYLIHERWPVTVLQPEEGSTSQIGIFDG